MFFGCEKVFFIEHVLGANVATFPYAHARGAVHANRVFEASAMLSQEGEELAALLAAYLFGPA